MRERWKKSLILEKRIGEFFWEKLQEYIPLECLVIVKGSSLAFFTFLILIYLQVVLQQWIEDQAAGCCWLGIVLVVEDVLKKVNGFWRPLEKVVEIVVRVWRLPCCSTPRLPSRVRCLPVVCAQHFEEGDSLIWEILHQSTSILAHAGLGAPELQARNVLQGSPIVVQIWKGNYK